MYNVSHEKRGKRRIVQKKDKDIRVGWIKCIDILVENKAIHDRSFSIFHLFRDLFFVVFIVVVKPLDFCSIFQETNLSLLFPYFCSHSLSSNSKKLLSFLVSNWLDTCSEKFCCIVCFRIITCLHNAFTEMSS